MQIKSTTRPEVQIKRITEEQIETVRESGSETESNAREMIKMWQPAGAGQAFAMHTAKQACTLREKFVPHASFQAYLSLKYASVM